MTPEQKRTLDFIREHFAEHGRGPTVRQIQSFLGLSSTSGIVARLKALVDYGYLRRSGEKWGNYVPVEAPRLALKRAATGDLVAELRQRGIVVNISERAAR